MATGDDEFIADGILDNTFNFPWDDDGIAEDVKDIKAALEASLFLGTSANSGGTFQDTCERYGGHVPGAGPSCVGGDSDLVAWKLAECYYKAAMSCIGDYNSKSADNCSRYETLTTRYTFQEISGISQEEVRVYFDREKELLTEQQSCLDKIQDGCECKRCVFLSHNLPKPEDEDTPPDDLSTAPTPDPDTDASKADPTLTTIKTSSSFSAIPVVFGEYVVGGNLIWVKDPESKVFTTSFNAIDGRSVGPLSIPTRSFGFMLGVAAGELEDVLRVWFGDVVVYNKTISVDGTQPIFTRGNDGGIDLEQAMQTDGTYAMARMAATKPILTWFRGSAHQKVNPDYAKKVGFGKTPAHRDLAYIYFSNINLDFFADGGFPEIKVDVVSNATNSAFAPLEGDISGHHADHLDIDLRTQEVITVTDTQIKMVDLNTLEATYTTELPTSTQTVVKMPSAELLAITDDMAFVLDPYSGDTLASTAYIGGLVDSNCVSMLYHNHYVDPDGNANLDGDQFPHDFIFLSSADGSVQCIDYDYTREVISSTHSIAAAAGYTLSFAAVTALAGDITYLQLLMPTGTQDHILRKAFKVTDAGALVETITSVDVNFTGLFGAETTGISIEQGFIDSTDNSFVLFIKTPTRSIITKVQMDGALSWSVDSSYAFPATSSQGERRSSVPTSDYVWITPTGEVVSVTLSDGIVSSNGGIVTLKTTLADQGWPAITGAQYFEGHTRTILYVTTDGVARVFLDKITAQAISLADVFERMGTMSGLPLDTINADAIRDITVKGLQIGENDTVRGVAAALAPFYQFAMIDDGTRIFFTREAAQTDIVEIDDADYLENSLTVAKELPATENLTASVKFVTINDLGLNDTTQTASLRPDDGEVFDDDGLNFQFAINDDPAHMRQYLEKVLAIQQDTQKSLSVDLSPKYLALTPVDRVSFEGTVYRLYTHMLNNNNRIQVEGDMFIQSNVVSDVDISTVQNFTGGIVAKTTKVDPYRPTILFTNALTDLDAERSFNGNQVVYVGVEAPTDDINPTHVSFRTPAQYGVGVSPLYTSQAIKKSLKVGRIVSPPRSRTNIFTSDSSDSLVVKFRRASALTTLQNFAAPYYDVQELPLTNLLIVGKEYIQFGSFEVAADGLTVTFKNLFRGRFGTEQYATSHAADERVYVYDPSTLVTMTVDAAYTHMQNSGSVYVQTPVPAGVPLIDFGVITDGGAARPYAPTHATIFARDGYPPDIAFSWLHRRSVNTDLMQNGGAIPNDWHTTKWVVYYQTDSFTAADFEDLWIKHLATSSEVVWNNPLGGVLEDAVTADFPPGGVWVAVAQCALDKDSSRNYIVGHPYVFWLPNGQYGTYPEYSPP